MSVPGGIDVAFNSAPDLVNTPGTALDVANSIDPTTFAPVVSHIQDTQATLSAVGTETADNPKLDGTVSDSGGGGLFGSIAHTFQSIPGIKGVEHALGTAIHYAASPLREIQRDYRFVHTVWTKNGPVAGILATLGVATAAGLGAYAGGPEGAIVGGEAAGFLERQGAEAFGGHGQGYTANGQTHYNEGLAATADASSDPHMKISFGRDLASALGQVPGLHTLANTDKGVGKVVSGGADATADWFMDPIVVGAKIKTGLKLGEFGNAAHGVAQAGVDASRAEAAISGPAVKVRNAAQRLLSGDLLRTMQRDGAAKFFDKVAPGIQLPLPDGTSLAANSEQINRLWASGSVPFSAGASYRRAADQIAKLNTGEIVAKFPELQDLAPNVLTAPGAEAIKGLGAAQTGEQVHQVIVNAIENAHFADRLGSINVVPTRTLTRTTISKVSDVLQNIDKNAATVTDEDGFVTRAQPRQRLTGATVSAARGIVTGNLGGAKDAITGAVARKINTFSGQLPYAIDPELNKISGDTFTVDAATGQVSPGAAKGLLNSFKFSMGKDRARYWTGQFLNANSLGDQKRIMAEANFELLKAAGILDDPQVIQDARRQLADISAGPMDAPGGQGGGNGVYGWGFETGDDVHMLPSGDNPTPGALHNYQTNITFSFPNFADIKQQMREMHGAVRANYGRFDDLMSKKYIGRIFKPLALVNAGFGFRVAMAEAIPEAMREGAMTHLRSMVAAKAAKMNYKLAEGEDDHTIAAMAHALSARLGTQGASHSLVNGIDQLLNNPIARDRAAGLVIRHGGAVATGAVRTGESTGGWQMDQDPAHKAQQGTALVKSWAKNQPQLKWRGTDDFDYFANSDANWDGYWHAELSRMASDPAVRAKAKDLLALGQDRSPEAVSSAVEVEAARIKDAVDGAPGANPIYVREMPRLSAYANIQAQNMTPLELAAKRVDSIRGMTTGADGTVHTNFLEALGAGRAPALADVSEVPLASRPKQVYGNVAAPYVGANVMQRIVKYGFAHVVDPIINNLSRDPQFFTSYSKELDKMLPAMKAGTLDQETAERIAETRATVGMIPKIHNTLIRSQFSVLARNYMPFYFAQEQALRRVGRLVATNPEALRQYQLVQQGLNDPGFVHKDDQGNKFFMFPHMGVLQDATNGLMGLFGDQVQTGLPMTVQGSMSSLQTLLPDFNMPGVSPLVSIPLNKLAGLMPELSPDVKQITGAAGFGQSAFDALIPNTTAKAAWRAIDPNEKDSSMANAIFSAMASSFYHGTAPGPDASQADQAAWINRVKNNARSAFITKAIVGLVSPLAPQVSNEDPGLRDEFYKAVKKEGYATALAAFLKEHGTKAISYTVARSEPTISGAYLPYTNQAINYLNSPGGQQLIHSPYSVAGAFLVPQAQGKGDVQTIHAELIRNHLRSVDTPQEFLNAIDIAMGNNAISPGLDAHNAALAKVVNDPAATKAENANWSDYLDTQRIANPSWYNYWTSPDRKNLAQNAYDQFYRLFQGQATDGSNNTGKPIAVPNTPQAQLVRTLMDDYTAHAVEMAQLASAPERKAERANWTAYLQEQAKNPLLYSVINAVFARLDAAGVTPNGGGVGQIS